MSHVNRPSYEPNSEEVSNEQMKKAMSQLKWQTVKVHVSQEHLRHYFKFWDDAVTTRSGKEGKPFLTTTALYGPIFPHTKVMLTPGQGNGVEVIEKNYDGPSLIQQLTRYRNNTSAPSPEYAAEVPAVWVSVKDGGAIPDLGKSSNVFGKTGTLMVKQPYFEIPVVDWQDEGYHDTLAYYGAEHIKPGEPFYMGFHLPLFGIEYDTVLPDYIRQYEMSPFGGGGLFVEHHPFPHIWWPKPDYEGKVNCTCKITLGKKIAGGNPEDPKFHFTTFRVPADGSALAVDQGTIHNDSYTSGRQTVWLANTPADTVALRQTAPFTEIILSDKPH